MGDWFRQALTRRSHRQSTRGKPEILVVDPDERLVYLVKFSVGAIFCLTALEIAYMAFMHVWNSEIFAAIAGLIGTVTGIFVGRQAR